MLKDKRVSKYLIGRICKFLESNIVDVLGILADRNIDSII